MNPEGRKLWPVVACLGVVALFLNPVSVAGLVRKPPLNASWKAWGFSQYTNGCENVSNVVPFTFNNSTGQASSATTVQAHGCNLPGGNYSLQSRISDLYFPFRVPRDGFRNVSVRGAMSWTFNATARAMAASGVCPSSAVRTTSTTSAWYDNGSGSMNGNGNLNGTIVYNNSTAFVWNRTIAAHGSCSTFAGAWIELGAEIVDINRSAGTNKNLLPTTGPDWTGAAFDEAATITVNLTDWSCWNQTRWWYGSWMNTTATCTSQNVTTVTQSRLHSKVASGPSIHGKGSFNAPIWFNMTFYRGDRYAMIFVFGYGVEASSTGWKHGTACASVDMAAPGGGFTFKYLRVP